MKVRVIGLDLAKNVFQVHGVDERGKVVLRKQLTRSRVTEFFAALAPCLIGMEACGSSHHWGMAGLHAPLPTLRQYPHE